VHGDISLKTIFVAHSRRLMTTELISYHRAAKKSYMQHSHSEFQAPELVPTEMIDEYAIGVLGYYLLSGF
jgi:hypothetical protein